MHIESDLNIEYSFFPGKIIRIMWGGYKLRIQGDMNTYSSSEVLIKLSIKKLNEVIFT